MEEVILQATDLRKTYGKRCVLRNVCLTVKKGEILGLAGENGAGKSTLIRLLAGIQKPTAGTVFFKGKSIYKDKRNYCSNLGYVPQEIALFEELSGAENLKFFGKACHVSEDELPERIAEVTGALGFPAKELHRPVSEYSGGMKRKINLAAALLHHPAVLLLDEPAANLDRTSEEQVLGFLKNLAEQGTAIVYVGHHVDKMEQFCNQICTMENGTMIRS